MPLSGADRCAPAAQRRGDPLPATAAPVSRWLLIEQPGHWGRDALQSRLPPEVAGALTSAAARAGVRIVVVRRPGRSVAIESRAWAYVDSRPGRESVRWGRYVDHAELLGAPLQGVAGRPDARPVYLVCVHGRHDTCCAIRGRPVAAALAHRRPGQVWECSHVGGDRFAANAVVLPEGLYYGHVTVDSAGEVISAYDAGNVFLPLLRGRSSLEAPVQAAQHHARLQLDEPRIAALAPRRVSQTAPKTWRVVLAHGDREVAVSVRAELAPPERLTCSSGGVESVQVFRLAGWELD